jgi:hypothetical protein
VYEDGGLPGLDEFLSEQQHQMSSFNAPDGKPYTFAGSWAKEIDPEKGEVEIIQFMRPNARRQQLVATIDPERAKKAREHLVVSCENLMNGTVAIWTRLKTETDEQEKTYIALNSPPRPVCPKCELNLSREMCEGVLWCVNCQEHVEDTGKSGYGPLDPNDVLCQAIDSYEL